ncbi:MAG: hypothetical protein P1V34_11075 [Alphaproteobacteria bacterium]|nr:hypothetical protein [Alphaproteobacteria bacterium]
MAVATGVEVVDLTRLVSFSPRLATGLEVIYGPFQLRNSLGGNSQKVLLGVWSREI